MADAGRVVPRIDYLRKTRWAFRLYSLAVDQHLRGQGRRNKVPLLFCLVGLVVRVGHGEKLNDFTFGSMNDLCGDRHHSSTRNSSWIDVYSRKAVVRKVRQRKK